MARSFPDSRLLMRPGEARTRTSTVLAASPVVSRSRGTLRNSTGTVTPRSAVWRPAITNQSPAARARLARRSAMSPRRKLTGSPLPARAGSAAAGTASARPSEASSACLRAGPSSPRRIRPPSTTEIVPVSSDTTIARASVSSVRPIAARWRLPSVRLSSGFTVRGRKQAAAATRFPWRITAPSWSGVAGWKMLTSRS